MNHWLIQCSPKVWDVFEWWENEDGELESWTISKHLNRIRRGDTFAFWVGGTNAGVYATGSIAGLAKLHGPVQGGYWKTPPSGDQHIVPLKVDRYLFDSPIPKSTLIADPDFSDSLIIRMPRSGNPIELTQRQWAAIERRVVAPPRTHGKSLSRTDGSPVVMKRSLSKASEPTSFTSDASERLRLHRESRLVANYEADLGRPLQVVWASVKGGRIVADAYDPVTGTLIEAKSSSRRSDVRMAVGQLLDYQHHLMPGAKLAVLLPSAPTPDIAKWLKVLSISILVGRL